MKTRTVLGSVGVLLAAFAVTAGGCISSTPPVAPLTEDSGFSLSEDSGTTVGDTGSPASDSGTPADSSVPVDSTLPEDSGEPLDSSKPDSGEPVDSSQIDAMDSAVPQAFVRFGILFASYMGPPPRPQGPQGIGAPPPPGYDVCVAPHGTGQWQGPLVAGAGLSAGITAFQVSSYFSVPAGQDDVLIIPAGATCTIPDAGPDGGSSVFEITNAPVLPPGVTATVGIGPGSSMATPYVAVGLLDETSATAGNVNVRYASIFGPSVYGLGGGIAFDPLFSVTGTQVTDPTADTNGYREIPALASMDTSLQYQPVPGFLQWVLGNTMGLPAGTVLSAFAGVQQGDGNLPVLITCIDNTTPTTPGLSNCTVTATNATPPAAASYTRFASFLSDPTPPSVDFCIRYHGLPSFQGPILNPPPASGADAGVDAGTPLGLAPPSSPGTPATPLTGYFSVHGGFQYDVRLVVAGSTDCATGLGTDGLFDAPYSAIGSEINSTFAATGFLSVPNDAGEPMDDAGTFDAGPEGGVSTPLPSVALAFESFVDENYATPAASARVINFAAAYAQPLNISADNNNWNLAYIPYGAFGMPGVDVYGYQQVPAGAGQDFIVFLGDGTQAIYSDYSSSTNEADTFFLFQSGGQMIVTQCIDSNYQNQGLWPCNVLGFGG